MRNTVSERCFKLQNHPKPLLSKKETLTLNSHFTKDGMSNDHTASVKSVLSLQGIFQSFPKASAQANSSVYGIRRQVWTFQILDLKHEVCSAAVFYRPSDSNGVYSEKNGENWWNGCPSHLISHLMRFCLMRGTIQEGGPDLERNGCLSSSWAVALWAGSRTSILSKKPLRSGET